MAMLFYRQNITVILLRFYLPRPQLTIRTNAVTCVG